MQSASNVCLVLPFHDGAHVDASISSFVALTDDADAQEVDRVYKTQSKALQSEHDLLLSRSWRTEVERDGDDVERHGRVGDAADGRGAADRHHATLLPLLSARSLVVAPVARALGRRRQPEIQE